MFTKFKKSIVSFKQKLHINPRSLHSCWWGMVNLLSHWIDASTLKPSMTHPFYLCPWASDPCPKPSSLAHRHLLKEIAPDLRLPDAAVVLENAMVPFVGKTRFASLVTDHSTETGGTFTPNRVQMSWLVTLHTSQGGMNRFAACTMRLFFFFFWERRLIRVFMGVHRWAHMRVLMGGFNFLTTPK